MKNYIQEIIDYVEININKPITINDIEKHIGYSRYYLHKVFYIYLGYTIMQYVRIRKMEYARVDLINKKTVIDVALNYGYQSERSFRRAFNNHFKVSPKEVRNITYQLPRKIILDKIGGIKMLPYLSEVSKVDITKRYIVGNEKVSKNPEMDSIDFMMDYQIKNNIIPITEIGIDIFVNEEDTKKGLRGYSHYIVVSKEEYEKIEDENLIKKIIKPSKFMKLTIEEPFLDPFERIPAGWKKLFSFVNETEKVNEDIELVCFEEKVEMMDKTIMNLYVSVK